MVENNKGSSSDFTHIASEVFGTLLTITTILSGVYVSITFGWFSQAMIAPHPGTPMTSEMLTWAMTGIALGLIFISPLVIILLSWALYKFRNSQSYAIASWSGLIYCFTQDIIGVVALFCFSLIATNFFIGLTMIIAGAFVLLIPPILGISIGYRIGLKYSQSGRAVEGGKSRKAAPAVAMVLLILAVQVLILVVQIWLASFLVV